MAIIAPFQGITYNFHRQEDFSSLVAPPYDVIPEREQKEFYDVNPYNVIRLILGRQKTGDSDWDNRYSRAAETFNRWMTEGTLIRAPQPCLYITSLTYPSSEDGGVPKTRWGMTALVRIEEKDSGIILPHEMTFSAHKDDRLKLMRACSAQLSPIFGLYEDKDSSILKILKKSIDFSPQIDFDFKDNTKHRMWISSDSSLFQKVAKAMSDKIIFIADGHHRYETSRNFRNIMRARHGGDPSNRSYEFVMMYLSGMCDEGLTILPSHRLIKKVPDFQVKPFLEKVKKWFDIKEIAFQGANFSKECADLKKELKRAGDQNTAFLFYRHQADSCHLFSLKQGIMERFNDDLHPSLKKLDVLILSRLILQKGLGFSKQDLDNDGLFHYESSMEAAISQVVAGDCQMAFLLNPTRIEHVTEIAGNSLVMPRKSTYFFPKVLSGLTFNKIEPHETMLV